MPSDRAEDFNASALSTRFGAILALPERIFTYSASVVTIDASKLFRQLSPEELNAIRCIVREKNFAAGQEIFREGDSGDGIYVVKEGMVEISAKIGQDVRRVMSRIAPGDFFGEMAVLDYKPRSACATAAAETTVYFISRVEILKLIERSPVLAMTLLQEISNRLRDFNQQYLKEVVQAERLAVVGRFARAIVHDLKNPLNLIGLSAEMASMDQTSPGAGRKGLGIIRKQVERINDLVSEILEFTRGTNSDVVLTPMEYGTFVQQVLEEARPEAALKSVTIEVVPPLPSAEVLLNPKRLSRVFYNLFNNAIDVMPDGGRILLRFATSPTEVVTEIEDTGPGIAPELTGKLFEAFATHGKAHGTGLGLSITKRIIEDHRGWISARNEPGRGAIFSFGLPLCGTPQSGRA